MPGKGVIVAVVVCQTVRTLAVVSDKTKFITAGADDNAVVGTKGERHLTFLFCAEGDVFDGIVVVTGGLQMTDTSFKTALDLTEMTAVAEYGRQLTRLRMQRGVEDKITAIVATDVILGCA